MKTWNNIGLRQMDDMHAKTEKELGRILERLKAKTVFVFDWDGTIIDSMEQKAENFAVALCSILQSRDKANLREEVKDRFLQLSGYPRKQIFNEIIVNYKNQKIQDAYASFNVAFEKLNKDLLQSSNIFPDALSLLQELVRGEYMIFISSSVPQQELSGLVEAILPMEVRKHISGVLGSEQGHSKGRAHLKTIMETSGVNTENIIVLGDDIADYALSSAAGVDCILVRRSRRREFEKIGRIESLNQIRSLLLA